MDATTAAMLGGFIGGIVLCFLIASLAGLAMKEQEPTTRAVAASLVAYLFCSILAGFGGANGGPYYWFSFVIYAPGALVTFVIKRWQYRRGWTQE